MKHWPWLLVLAGAVLIAYGVVCRPKIPRYRVQTVIMGKVISEVITTNPPKASHQGLRKAYEFDFPESKH